VTREYIPVNIPWVTEEDADYVRQAVAEGWISGEGKYVAEFEEGMAALCRRKNAIAVSNGSVAIDLVIEALGIGPGDEVILPSFTIISCLAQILRNGATPVFVDALPDTWNMNVSQVESLITSRTKAIMAVHVYGLPVDMDPLLEIANSRGIPVIEDAAESHGLKYKDRIAGSMGLVSTFSFYANKNITTGEGGMVLTDDELLASKVRSLRNLAFLPEKRFVHEELGWNSRMSSLQCALGTSQLKRVHDILERRKTIARLYDDAFSDLEACSLPKKETHYAENNYWVYGLVMKPELERTAAEVMGSLDKKGIGSRPFFFPLHHQPVLGRYGFKFEKGARPESELLGKFGFYIPNGLGMSLHETERVAQAVRETILER
jgi:perosamine synthetase